MCNFGLNESPEAKQGDVFEKEKNTQQRKGKWVKARKILQRMVLAFGTNTKGKRPFRTILHRLGGVESAGTYKKKGCWMG